MSDNEVDNLAWPVHDNEVENLPWSSTVSDNEGDIIAWPVSDNEFGKPSLDIHYV